LLSAACELYESSTPYFPFRSLLRAALGVGEDESDLSVARRLHEIVETTAPTLLPWIPLLAIPLGVDVPLTPQVVQLEEQFRRGRLAEVLVTLLSRVLDKLTLITLEDVHWLDEASSDLLRRLANDVEHLPWLICVTRRDVGTGFIAPSAPHVVTLMPEPLDDRAAAALADAVTEASPLSQHELATLAERSGGNPLFLKELLAAAGQSGGTVALPDSVEAVITARIDRLPPRDRELLRHVSVLGFTFQRDLAESVLPEEFPTSDDAVWRRLAEFISEDRAGTVRFKHALIRDAAYEGLPYRLRQTLHGLVGDTIASREGAFEEDVELLSLHFFYAGRFEPAWDHSCTAAERARMLYANVDAATFYERAIEAGRHEESIDASELARVYESLGDVRKRIGEFLKAVTAYRAARRLSYGDPISSARLMQKQGGIRQVAGRHAEALRLYRKARQALQAAEGIPAAAQLAAQISVSYASVKKDQGRPSEVIKWCLRAIEEGIAADDKDAIGHAYLLLDAAYAHMGRYEKATYAPSALTIYEELGDLRMQGGIRNNLGVWAHNLGRWQEAQEHFGRALEAFAKVGDTIQEACTMGNVGEVLSDQGRFDEADQLFRRSLRVCRAAGDRRDAAYALRNLGRLAYRRGRFNEATDLLEQARAEFAHVGAEADVVETDAAFAECLVLRGDSRPALEASEQALKRGASASAAAGPQEAHLQRVRGYALAQLGKLEEAKEALAISLRAARSRNSDYDTALTLHAIERIARIECVAAPDAAEESALIFDRLGVRYVAEVPLPDAAELSPLTP